MRSFEESIEIKRPVEKVFAYTTDANKWTEWESFILEAEQTSGRSMEVGATYRGVSRMMGRSMKWTAIVTQYEPGKRWGKDITSGSLAIEEHVTYKPLEGGTIFTMMYGMKASGFLSLLLPVLTGAMRKGTRKSLVNLKNILEK